MTGSHFKAHWHARDDFSCCIRPPRRGEQGSKTQAAAEQWLLECRRRPHSAWTDARPHGGKRTARTRTQAAREVVRLPVCAESEGEEGAQAERAVSTRVYSICCPTLFFGDEFAAKVRANREHEKQRWIFDLIAGKVAPCETVFLEDADWLLVEGSSYGASPSRYLVIFKDLELQTLRDLRQQHLPMLRKMRRRVRGFLAARHANHADFRLYFHYLPSVFQLHMHVCCAAPVDVDRRHYLPGVMRNIEAVDTWYRDALMLFSVGRQARATACVSQNRGEHKRLSVCI